MASWIDTGLTPARLGIITAASGLHIFTYARRDELIAAGKDNSTPRSGNSPRSARTPSTPHSARLSAPATSARPSRLRAPAGRPTAPWRCSPARTRPPPRKRTPPWRGSPNSVPPSGESSRSPRPTSGPLSAGGSATACRSTPAPWPAPKRCTPGFAARPAARPPPRPRTYDSADAITAPPEGLRTSQGSDTRIAPWILWEEIPAWIQPGLSASLRDRLAAAEPGPARRTHAHSSGPPAGRSADPAGQADDPATRAAARGDQRGLGRHRGRAAALARRPGSRPHLVPGHGPGSKPFPAVPPRPASPP